MNSIEHEIRKELLDKWSEVEQNIDSMITTKLSEVSYWKYASDEYFTHLPYFHEINKFKKGRILKNITKSERFSKRMIHSFGFNELDELIIMQYPQADNDIKLGTGTQIYTINPDKSVNAYVARWYPENNFPTKLLSISIFKPLDDRNWVDVSVNGINWSFMNYIYNDSDRIEKVVSCNSDVESPLCYNFFYDNEEKLEKIMIDEIIWWKRRK
ncbi:hypothetical protein [Lysinibacillus sp. JNUCC-52]|uniref:hypothetical protein n=1 Tax=Lysinibacillus sp. JNUCC-52 TaxID=2792480 RepID=UPI001938407F|nr:hypothetical protein JNUCC52_22020 [Lysinibacillus sp. JNUCC-52]